MADSIPVVAEVKVISPYTLEVHFRDGCCRRVDLEGQLHGEVFGPLRDPAVFAQAFVDPVSHTVAWPNGADLAPEWLYEPDAHRYWEMTKRGRRFKAPLFGVLVGVGAVAGLITHLLRTPTQRAK